MKLDRILLYTQILSLLSFLINTLLVFIGDLFRSVSFAVLSLFIFIGISYVNESRRNGVNQLEILKQVAGIILGTIMIMIAITLGFKVYNAFI